MENDLVIGVDPGKVTGLAIYDISIKKIVACESTDFWGAFDILKKYMGRTKEVVIELPNTKSVWHKAQNRAAMNRTAVNVGSCLREAELLVLGAKMLGHAVVTVHPQGKVSAVTVKAITGYDGKPNNAHTRDAILLAWGKE